MSFETFDTSKLDAYAAQAKQSWGETPVWAEYEARRASRSAQDEASMGGQLMALFVPFEKMAAESADPTSEEAQTQAASIQRFISEHFYACTNDIFARLGHAYGAGGEFTSNIDAAAGPGAAEFASKAIEAYCAADRRQ